MTEKDNLERPAFVPTRLDEDRENDKGKTIGVWFNDAELINFKEYGIFLHQEKPATIIKQMMALGAKLTDDKKIRAVRDLVFNNVRKNKRLGISEVEPRISKT